MTDRRDVDRERPVPHDAYERPDSTTGQPYDIDAEIAEGRKAPSGHPLSGDPSVTPAPSPADGRDIPPEAGRRGYVDPKTGEVHGSGAGAGGGAPGEDYDTGTAGAAPETPQSGAGSDRPT